jgi:hypothetical protein
MSDRLSMSARRGRFAFGVLIVGGLVGLGARDARAAEVSAFLSGAKPYEAWGSGFGGTLGITLFNLVGLEFEGAWQGGQTAASDMWSASGRAYVGPQFKRFVPYLGLSTGLYRQALGSTTDTGSTRGVIAGLKFRLPLAIFVRAEYQWVALPEEALVKMDDKYLLGVGLSF